MYLAPELFASFVVFKVCFAGAFVVVVLRQTLHRFLTLEGTRILAEMGKSIFFSENKIFIGTLKIRYIEGEIVMESELHTMQLLVTKHQSLCRNYELILKY
jgi:hypothetical protein